MSSEISSRYLCRALSQLSPDIFFHPLWVNLTRPVPAGDIQELANTVQPLVDGGDLNAACQILLGCAALEKRLTAYPQAVQLVDWAWDMAKSAGFNHVSHWAAWGSSALSFIQGNTGLAAKTLSWLQESLHRNQEWAVEIIIESLLRSLDNQSQASPELQMVIQWLARWGESPVILASSFATGREDFGQTHSLPVGKGHPETFDMGSIPTRSLFRRIFELGETFRKVAAGEYRLSLKWVEVQRKKDNLPVKKIVDNPVRNPLPLSRLPPTPIIPSVEDQASLLIYCLGPFRAILFGRLIESWTSKKALAVFKYLVTHQHVPVYKDILMETFWPDTDPEAARRNLHQAIYALRQTLKARCEWDQPIIQYENDCYRVNSTLTVWLDYEEFERHAKIGLAKEEKGELNQAMAEYGIAENLYLDDFLAEDLYEDWPQANRQQLRQIYFFIAHRLARHYLSKGEHAAAIALCRRILAKDNCQEEAHQVLMRAYNAQGQRNLAISQYQFCVQALKNGLDMSPSAETLELYHAILQR